MKKLITVVVILGGLGAVLGGLYLVKKQQFAAMAEAGANAPLMTVTVNTHVVAPQEWERRLHAVGTVTAVQGVVVRNEFPGLVTRIAFESGDAVQRGDVLVELDASIEKAQLEAAEAALELAEISLKRTAGLREQNTVPQSELDRAVAEAKQARAALSNIEAVVAKMTIRAPFDGVLGIRQVDEGDYITGGAPLVTLRNHAQVYVDFSLPQRDIPVLERGMIVRAHASGILDKPVVGSLTSRSAEVERGSRNIGLRALFDNPDGNLVTGMFVDVDVVLPTEPPVLAIPQTAVKFAPFGNSVFVLKRAPEPTDEEKAIAAKTGMPLIPAGTPVVEQRFVRLGRSRGDFVEVIEGVAEGEEIVATGVFQLANKTPVTVNNSIQLEYSTEPQPDNA